MRENSYFKLYEYFKKISQNSVFVQDFAGYFKHDLDAKIQSFNGIQSPYLALWDYNKEYLGENQSTLAVISLGYVVLKNDVPVDDIQAQYQAIDQCERIAKHINSRLRFDNLNPKHFLFNSFLKDKTRISPVDMKEVGFGVEVMVYFKNPEILELNPAEWADIDQACHSAHP